MKNILKRLIPFLCIFIFIFLCSCNGTSNDTDTNTNTDTDNKINEPITPANVEILKIGKADCIIINTGSKLVMIDTGEEEDVSTITTYMRLNNYDKIDVLILTHYDKDHIGGASEVISRYNVETIIESKFDDSTLEYIYYHSAMYDKDQTPLKLAQNYKFTFDSCEFEINVPQKNKYTEKKDNNTSLIVSVKCGDTNLLFAGDAMEERLEEFIKDNQTAYDFIKLPYHGIYLDNYREFLDSTKPKYGAVTDSSKNPTETATINILNEFNVTLYQTRYGKITVTTDGEKITIKQN